MSCPPNSAAHVALIASEGAGIGKGQRNSPSPSLPLSFSKNIWLHRENAKRWRQNKALMNEAVTQMHSRPIQ